MGEGKGQRQKYAISSPVDIPFPFSFPTSSPCIRPQPARKTGRGRGAYRKVPNDSIGSKEATIGAAGADREPHRTGAAWAVSHVGRLLAIDVNSCVHATTGELDAQETPPAQSGAARSQHRIARQVQVFARHAISPAVQGRLSRGGERTRKCPILPISGFFPSFFNRPNARFRRGDASPLSRLAWQARGQGFPQTTGQLRRPPPHSHGACPAVPRATGRPSTEATPRRLATGKGRCR